MTCTRHNSHLDDIFSLQLYYYVMEIKRNNNDAVIIRDST